MTAYKLEIKKNLDKDLIPYTNFFIIVLLQLSQFSPIALCSPDHLLLTESIPTLFSMSLAHLYLFFN